MQDKEESEKEIGYPLKRKAESILNLVEMLVRMELGYIESSEDIKKSAKSLIKDLCSEIIEELD